MGSIIDFLESENIKTIFCIIWTFRIINCINYTTVWFMSEQRYPHMHYYKTNWWLLFSNTRYYCYSISLKAPFLYPKFNIDVPIFFNFVWVQYVNLYSVTTSLSSKLMIIFNGAQILCSKHHTNVQFIIPKPRVISNLLHLKTLDFNGIIKNLW